MKKIVLFILFLISVKFSNGGCGLYSYYKVNQGAWTSISSNISIFYGDSVQFHIGSSGAICGPLYNTTLTLNGVVIGNIVPSTWTYNSPQIYNPGVYVLSFEWDGMNWNFAICPWFASPRTIQKLNINLRNVFFHSYNKLMEAVTG